MFPYQEHKILDHGYIKCIQDWGSDISIIEAARMSTSKGFQGWGTIEQPGDEKLLKYLWEHKHHTPFEMAGLTIEVQAPIFVFREWHRHRTQSYNELSARYTALPDLYYLPSIERIMGAKQASKNKQSSEEGIDEQKAKVLQEIISHSHQGARAYYETLLGYGVARELARIVVPVAQYSRMRASANLRNWLAFMTLRSSLNAQFEIRQYAEALGVIIHEFFPRTWELYCAMH